MVEGGDPHPPTGRQHEISHDGQVAIVGEVGATLRRYATGGIEVLDGFDAGERSTAGRGQVLAPWPNRLDGGRYRFEGVEARAALDEPELGNAIHGLVRWLPWPAVSQDERSVHLGCVVHPQPAYPWRLELEVEYRLDQDGLQVTAGASNGSATACPFRDRLPPLPHGRGTARGHGDVDGAGEASAPVRRARAPRGRRTGGRDRVRLHPAPADRRREAGRGLYRPAPG